MAKYFTQEGKQKIAIFMGCDIEKINNTIDWILPLMEKIRTRRIYGTCIPMSISIINDVPNKKKGFEISNRIYQNEVLCSDFIESAYKISIHFIDWYAENRKLGL